MQRNADENAREIQSMKTGGEYMTAIGEVYLCGICGNKVKILESGGGTLVCCGQPMELTEA